MTRTQRRRTQGWASFLAGLLAIGLFGASPAAAVCSQDPCAGGGDPNRDCDQDGLTDEEECRDTGITVDGVMYESCRSSTASGVCVEPAVPTVFVLVNRVPGGPLDTLGLSNDDLFARAAGDPIQIITLDGATAVLSQSPIKNGITPLMGAVPITEDARDDFSCGSTKALGVVNPPQSANQTSGGKVFSKRITTHVDCVHDDGGTSPTSPDRTADKIRHIEHTCYHELLHTLFNAPEYAKKFGGRHYSSRADCRLSQSVTYSTRKGVVFNIPTKTCGPTLAALDAGEGPDGKTLCADALDLASEDAFLLEDELVARGFPAGTVCLPAQ